MRTCTAGSLIVTLALTFLSGRAIAQEEETADPDAEEDPAAVEGAVGAEVAPVEATTTTEAEVMPEEAPAEEPAASLAPKISGHVNGTYNYNFLKPADGINRFHSYSIRDNTFMLNAAHVAITGSDDRMFYAVEIDAGTDAIVNTVDDDFDLQEAYLGCVAESGIGFKVGKFVTYNGIEVIESPANPTISRGFLFGLVEPFGHVGGVVTYKVSDTIDVAAGMINGWDQIVDNNDLKTFFGKVGITTEKVLLTISAHVGPEQAGNNDDLRTTFDATGVAKMIDKMDLWFQLNYGMEAGLAADGGAASWVGAGVQPLYHVSDDLAIGARVEVLADSDGARTGGEQTLFNISVAPAYNVYGPIVMRAEARIDVSSEEAFINADGEPGTTQIVALTEAIVAF